MKITAQEEYGLRCLLRLAEAPDGHSLTIPEMATVEGLSPAYTAKILAGLRQAGLIESVRGRTGGYRLARNPTDIGLGSVLKVLGEPLYDDPGVHIFMNVDGRFFGTSDGGGGGDAKGGAGWLYDGAPDAFTTYYRCYHLLATVLRGSTNAGHIGNLTITTEVLASLLGEKKNSEF